jgi:hypothetical protein
VTALTALSAITANRVAITRRQVAITVPEMIAATTTATALPANKLASMKANLARHGATVPVNSAVPTAAYSGLGGNLNLFTQKVPGLALKSRDFLFSMLDCACDF